MSIDQGDVFDTPATNDGTVEAAIVRVGEKTLAESVYAVEMPITTRYQFDVETVKAITRRKLVAIEKIMPVAKRGTAKVTNTSSYDYAKPEDVFRAANEALLEAGLDVTPLPRGTEQILAGKTYNGTDMVLTRLYVDMLVASEEGFVLYPWMADSKMMDPSKAIQAAMTYAHRTFLIHFLRIPTPSMDDADAESYGEAHNGRKPERAANEAPKANGAAPRNQSKGQTRNAPASTGVMWNDEFWNTVTAFGYWNDESGDVNKRHFFGSLKKGWPQAPSLSENTAPQLLQWAKKYAELRESEAAAAASNSGESLEGLSEQLFGPDR